MPTLCRPSAATLVAIVVTLAIGTQTALAAAVQHEGPLRSARVSSLEVTAADASSVTIEWPPSRFEWKVAGYGIYVDGAKVGTVRRRTGCIAGGTGTLSRTPFGS